MDSRIQETSIKLVTTSSTMPFYSAENPSTFLYLEISSSSIFPEVMHLLKLLPDLEVQEMVTFEIIYLK